MPIRVKAHRRKGRMVKAHLRKAGTRQVRRRNNVKYRNQVNDLKLTFSRPLTPDYENGKEKMIFVDSDKYKTPSKSAGNITFSIEPNKTLSVRLAMTTPKFHRQGVARQTYQHLIRYAKDNGYRTLTSDPDSGTKSELHKLWRATGAKEVRYPKVGQPKFRLRLNKRRPRLR